MSLMNLSAHLLKEFAFFCLFCFLHLFFSPRHCFNETTLRFFHRKRDNLTSRHITISAKDPTVTSLPDIDDPRFLQLKQNDEIIVCFCFSTPFFLSHSQLHHLFIFIPSSIFFFFFSIPIPSFTFLFAFLSHSHFVLFTHHTPKHPHSPHTGRAAGRHRHTGVGAEGHRTHHERRSRRPIQEARQTLGTRR